ncbi:DUF262 domain-containing protein [Candidatus Viridilinea mediisalina]|uniref:GmrSD restriction endonucleases N-terminal domain-containing protein n=1 Tax=Candidatus Viridilinea mediisalina TaxID=2024553 RepID=A0A2A6RPH0_9CHLR|nr:DUF262 domain-containing protein [Candidatus Viridilinea mediisalina]PDW04768.1 hypothetical protein CJ255_01620 [Candidatus Viridilinea mediisalina]
MTANDDRLDDETPELNEENTGVEREDVVGEDRSAAPFDPTLIRVETRALTIDLLLARMQEEEINLTPDFQRKAGIWSNEAQSRLIESILTRIPLPAFYLDTTDDDQWIVVDGLQRLTTLRRFAISQELRLCGLEFLTQLNGKSFDELPRNFQRRIRETQVTAFLIARGTPDEVKFTIFRRINTGGKPLSPQEIRHALNQGPVTALLAELAQADEFQRAIDRGVASDRMDDRELVLRFFAFNINSYTNYVRQDFDTFLNGAMKQINKLPQAELDRLTAEFKRAMVWAYKIFGRDAFRKRYKAEAKRQPINKPLFEAWAINLHTRSDEQLAQLVERRDLLIAKFIDLMNEDRTFDNAISQGTGDVKKVKYRFTRLGELIEEVLA